mgnify:CR=1 FL=1
MWPDKGLLAEKLLADRAYTANKLFALAERQSHEVAIPPVKGRLLQREYTPMRTKSAIWLNVSLPRLSHFGEQQRGMISFP